MGLTARCLVLPDGILDGRELLVQPNQAMMMSAKLVKIINVRVDGAVARAIERRVAAENCSLSDFARACLLRGIGQAGPVVTAAEHRERAARLAAFQAAATILQRLGNLHVYALKAGRPVSADEERARLVALGSVRDAARRLVDP